jgi:hypothetical protein
MWQVRMTTANIPPDVLDTARLTKYLDKRREWLRQLEGDEHSVWTQIHTMLWNDAIFRSVNSARNLASEAKVQAACLNGPLAGFIDMGYVATQKMAIRRLADPPRRKRDKQVISLNRVLEDIAAHSDLITREIFVCHQELPFATGAAAQRYYTASEVNTGIAHWLGSIGDEAFDHAERTHEAFDKLSGVSPKNRQRDDLISPAVFEQLRQELSASGWEDFVEMSHKYIAHAADTDSRATLTDDQIKFTLDKVSRCQLGICRVARALYGKILYESDRGLLPTYQHDFYDQLEAPWLPNELQENLWKAFDNRKDEISEWEQDDIEFIVPARSS